MSRHSLLVFGLIVAVTSCTRTADPVAVNYVSYDDCILGKLGRGQSTVATKAIIQACRAKYPLPPAAPVEQSAADRAADEAAAAADAAASITSNAITYRSIRPGVIGRYVDGRLVQVIGRNVTDADRADATAGASGAPPLPDSGPVWNSGHQAGYAWAENHGVTDPGECDGDSRSFIEGCEAWAAEQ